MEQRTDERPVVDDGWSAVRPHRERVRTVLTLTSPGAHDLAVGLDATVPPEIRPLTRDELDVVLEWGDGSGPDPYDAGALWDADPSGLWGVELDGVVVAAGSTLAHQGQLGRVGFVAVRPELRRRGLGEVTLQFLVDDLLGRLSPDAAILLDATTDVIDHAERRGFVAAHRIVRCRGAATVGRRGPHTGEIRALASVPFETVVGLDTQHTGVVREDLLRTWIVPPGGLGLGVYERGELHGMGVIRRTRTGMAIGPLYADEPDVAEDLLTALTGRVTGTSVTLDVPEPNGVALGLATAHGLARDAVRTSLVLGDAPALPLGTTYGITSYELG